MILVNEYRLLAIFWLMCRSPIEAVFWYLHFRLSSAPGLGNEEKDNYSLILGRQCRAVAQG